MTFEIKGNSVVKSYNDPYDNLFIFNKLEELNKSKFQFLTIFKKIALIKGFDFEIIENNEVELVSTNNNIIEDTYLGVKYTNIINFKQTECDYIIIMNNLNSLSILNIIK